jgi:transcriptional regulator with XRE-family HTH domain
MSDKNLRTGAALQEWRTSMGLSAKRLGELIGITQRSINRAEKSAKLGVQMKLAIELLRSRLAYGEIDLQSYREPILRPEAASKKTPAKLPSPRSDWHGELRTGTDLRRWRECIDLYQKELAELLNVDVTSLIRAERSDAPSSRLTYGAELLKTKISSGDLDLRTIKDARVKRGRPKKI